MSAHMVSTRQWSLYRLLRIRDWKECTLHGAGTYILDACVYLFPNTNFALIDSDCVPVTLYEVQELWRSCDDFAHSGDPLAPDQTPTSPIAPAHKRARSEFVLDSKTEPLGCYVAMHCRYCTETKTLGKHLNSSAGFLFQLGAL